MLKNGCIEDPKYQSKYCDEHSKDVPLRKVVGEQQVLTNKDEFHISEVLRRVTKKNKRLYEVKWKGYEDTTLEPRENIPRVLIELFEKHGDSSITTTIKNHFDKSGTQYVTLGVEGHEDMILPACSLQIDENALDLGNRAYYVNKTIETSEVSIVVIKYRNFDFYPSAKRGVLSS